MTLEQVQAVCMHVRSRYGGSMPNADWVVRVRISGAVETSVGVKHRRLYTLALYDIFL